MKCPNCQSENIYQYAELWTCPDCAHEWAEGVSAIEAVVDNTIRDANGVELKDGDSVSVIKDLKVKGASSSIKVGTKVKNIRLEPDSNDGHNISCRIEGFGAMNLKSEFVKKV